MKKIFVAMMAMAALAACSNEETLSFDKEAIGFSNAFVNNSVRSIDPSIVTGTLDSFFVYGTTKGNHNGAQVVNVFNGVEVEKVTTVNCSGKEKSKWRCCVIHKWFCCFLCTCR